MSLKSLKGKQILVTGGTGSFGYHFIKKIHKMNCKIIVFSRDELKQFEMRNKFKSKNISYIIGDVREKNSLDIAMRNVDYVFHAAALKQVPSCEFFPMEAVKTNIIGSENVLDSAIKNNVKRVILLSTDKAVLPVNAMGMSKALMEKIAVFKSREDFNKHTKISIVRYGNVLMSRGSVVPLLINQIKNGKDLTVTHKDMTRFLMPLDDAVNLVLLTIKKNSKHTTTYVHKAPAANVLMVAKILIDYYNSKSKINMIGIRNGEKLHETLISSEEFNYTKEFKNHFEIKHNISNLDYKRYFSVGNKSKIRKEYNSEQAINISNVKKILINEIKRN